MRSILKYKKFIVRLLIVAGLFFLIGFYRKYHLPKIKDWLLVEIENQSRKHSPLRLWPKQVELGLFPIAVRFYDTRVLPQKGFEKIIEPTHVAAVNIKLSMWALLKGQLRIGEIHIDTATLKLKIPSSGLSQKATNFSISDLEQIPIDKISASRLNIQSAEFANQINASTDRLDFSIARKYDTLRIAIDTENLKIKKTKEKSSFSTDLGARLLIDKDGIYISSIKATKDNSFLIGSVSILGDILNKQKIDLVKSKMRGDFNLNEVRSLVAEFIGEKKLPEISGQANFDAEIEYKPGQPLQTKFSLQTKSMIINQYNINQLSAEGHTNEKFIQIAKAKIENDFGQISLDSSNLNLDENFSFNGRLQGKDLNLHKFLAALNLKDVPVYIHLNGEFPCRGQIKNKFTVTCEGEITGRDFSVLSSVKKPFTIVALKSIGATGSVTVTDKQVSYKANLEINKSKGESSGVISYADGFKINYSSPALNFSDIADLAGLKPEGVIQLKGSTSGSSKSGVFNISATARETWLYNFYLGKVSTQLEYRKGTLNFDKIEAQIGSSRFKGDLAINVRNNTMTLDGASPFIDAEDLLTVFKRKVELPFKVTGTGSAKVSAYGPLDFSKLSYNLNSSLYRGTIADETFDQIQFNVVSKNGYVETRQATLSKSRSTISANGKVSPEGKINLIVQGQKFQIEQSENLARLKTNLTGNLNFEMTLTDHILKPSIDLIGSITHLMVGEQASLNSQFKITMTDKLISGSAELLGNALKLSFNSNYDSFGSTELNVKTTKWNVAQTFSIFSESLRTGSYQTNLTSDLHLLIPNRDPYNFSGEFSASELLLRNGRTEMSITKPIGLTVKNGIISANNFEIIGDNTYIRLKSTSSGKQNLGLTLDGRLDLSLASLLTPFLDDIRGLLKFSFSLDGTYKKPVLSGSSFVENALIKIKGFPHALEQVSGDAIFNNENIIINSTKGKIGGGQFSGSGRIEVRSIGQVPVEIKGQFYDSKFNVPEGITTRGSGEFFVRGSWFPYTVGVNFNVDSGLIEKRTVDTTKDTPDIVPSSYLPKYLSTQRFSPVHLALDINIRRLLPVRMSISRVDIKSEILGNMKIFGPPESPLMTGKINIIRGGKITFRNNTFEIKNGSLEYENSKPTNPSLNIQADARVIAQLKNNETRDYDVEMSVLGTAENPKITLSSQPALPENDLISLLTLGFINEIEVGEEEAAGPNLTNTSYQLGSALLNEQLGINRVLESRLGVQLDINSSYDSADKAEKHKFTLRKQWTPKFGTSGSKELGKTTTNSVKAEYKLNKNLSVIGEWEGKEPTGVEQGAQSEKELNLFGLDIEYKVDFK